MLTVDRTTKCLLAIIAIFLGVLVLRPLLQVTPVALAQSNSTTQSTFGSGVSNNSTTAANTGTVLGYRTVPVSRIALNKAEKLRSLQIIDSAQSFILQYDDRLEVYRVDDVTLAAGAKLKAMN